MLNAKSLQHAQQAGEIITGLDGHPDQGIAAIEEARSIVYNFAESLAHEDGFESV